jgi:Protein of unknown function (DUF2786)
MTDDRSAHDLEQLSEYDRTIYRRESQHRIGEAITTVWNKGWLPAEVVRQFRRDGDPSVLTLVRFAIGADTATHDPATVDPRWLAHLEALVPPEFASDADWLANWERAERISWPEVIRSVSMLLIWLSVMRPLPILIPPPGANRDFRTRVHSQSDDDPMLARIRALLAQAESTNFEAEAETFTAKAQELMTRHAIDEAMLSTGPRVADGVTSIRIAIDEPYFAAKCRLLARVAQQSRCRTVTFGGYAMAAVVGYAHDVHATEMLFTSLLVQAQAALRAATTGPAGSRARSRAFRSTFLFAYAERVGERLEEINDAVYADVEAETGQSFLPVLIERSALVDTAVTDLFGKLRSKTSRRRLDGEGWVSGRMAADRAKLNAGDLAPSRKRLSA